MVVSLLKVPLRIEGPLLDLQEKMVFVEIGWGVGVGKGRELPWRHRMKDTVIS